MGFEPINYNLIKKMDKKINEIINKFDEKINSLNNAINRLNDELNGVKNVIRNIDPDKFKNDANVLNMADVLKYVEYINDRINFLHGIDSKFMGYLYGGYKSGVAIDHIQRYNTMSEISNDIYTTGKKVSYVPGITTNNSGFFTWQDNSGNWMWNKFDYNTEQLGETLSSYLPAKIQVSGYNMGVGDEAFVSSGQNQSVKSSWLFKVSSLTFETLSISLLNSVYHSTRQALNNNVAVFMVGINGDSPHYIYEFETKTESEDTSHVYIRDQYMTGLSKDSNNGYWVDRTTLRKVKYDGKTILSLENMSYIFTYHFGESHTLQNFKAGFVMAGYDDNVGDYGGGQHGYVQKMNWDTETAYILPKLVFPQSSGEMVQR